MNLNDILGKKNLTAADIGRNVSAEVLNTVNQMYKKKLLPEDPGIKKLIYDNINGMASQYIITVFKEWSCLICGITVDGPKFLLLQHNKIHNTRDLKENEAIVRDYKVY